MSDEEIEQSIEIIDAENNIWEPLKITSQSQIQIEFMQGCSNCGKTLCKYGIAVSYKINFEVYKNKCLYTKTEHILLCLDDYNEILKQKFKIVDKFGTFELVEWIDQYNRKGWFPIAKQLNKEDIDNIITHTVRINNKISPLKCSICLQTVKDQIWV